MPDKNENISVSVIMTVYNAEEHIRESIDSILNQTLKSLEIVCVDGNSTDSTRQIISDYSESDPRIKLYTQNRPGIGAAKNCGIEWSVGKYITFLDADDFYVDSTALEKMLNICENNDVKVCGALRTTVFMDGHIDKELLHRKDCENNKNGVLLRYSDKQYDYHFHSYLYNREMIINSDARFAEISAYDDTHFFIRAMLKAEEFYVIPVELYRYRCGPAYDWGEKKALDAIKSLIDQLNISKNNNLSKLHWLTVQRINYEYGRIFVKNVKNGNKEILESLIDANRTVDSKMIDEVIENDLIDEYYLMPMLHRSLSDIETRLDDGRYGTKYVIEPLWILDHEIVETVPEKKNIVQRGITSLKKNGIIKTVKIMSSMLIHKIRRN